MDAITGDLSKIHPTETQGFTGSHDLGNGADFTVDLAIRIQEITAAYLEVEHGFADRLIVPLTLKSLFRTVIDAGGSERTEQIADTRDNLFSRRIRAESPP